MADRTILLAQNKRHATRGLSVVNPQEFLAYQEDDDNLTYIVDMGAYLDGATIVLVTRTPTGVVISNASNTTTRLTQRLAGYGHVDFRVQTSAGDTEQFRVYIQPRAANPAFFLTAGSGGGITALDGDKGDVIVSSAGSTWTLDPTAVARLNVFTDTLKGITPASGGGTTNFLRADGSWATPPGGGGGGGGPVSDADYGDITVSGTGTVWTIDNNAVTLAKMADMATASLIYRKTAGTGDPEVQTLATLKTDLGLTGTNSGDQTITLTGNVTGSGTGSFATTIAAGAVGLSQMANMATSSLIYRKTAGSGAPEVNTLATLKTDLGLTGTNSGDQTITLTGDVTGSGTGSFAATIANDAVTYAKIQNVSATNRILGRSTAGAGDIEEITCTAAGRALIDDADATAQRTTLGLGAIALRPDIVNADVNASAAIAYSKLASMTGGSVLLGNASNVPTVTALTGDVTVSNAGVTAIGTGVIVDADVNASAAIDATKLSFTQAGTGAVARTIDSKLKDVVSVADFGASPSATAAQNATRIQAAIDANPGKLIYFPPGAYEINNTLRISSDYTHLIGANRNSVYLRMTNSTLDAIHIAPATPNQAGQRVNGVTIENMTVHRYVGTSAGAGIHIQQGSGTRLVHVNSWDNFYDYWVEGSFNTEYIYCNSLTSQASSPKAGSVGILIDGLTLSDTTWQQGFTHRFLCPLMSDTQYWRDSLIRINSVDLMNFHGGYLGAARKHVVIRPSVNNSGIYNIEFDSVYFDGAVLSNDSTNVVMDLDNNGKTSSPIEFVRFHNCIIAQVKTALKIANGNDVLSVEYNDCDFHNIREVGLDVVTSANTGPIIRVVGGRVRTFNQANGSHDFIKMNGGRELSVVGVSFETTNAADAIDVQNCTNLIVAANNFINTGNDVVRSSITRSVIANNTTNRTLSTLELSTTTLGNSALASASLSGTNNTAVGYQAGAAVTSGVENTAIGSGALKDLTTGGAHTAVGMSALTKATTGFSNVAIGGEALEQATTAGNNTAIGRGAMRYFDTADNVAVGRSALAGSTTVANNTANQTVAVGRSALAKLTSGGANNAVGYFALAETTTGGSNTANGNFALGLNTTGSSNSALGAASLGNSTTGAGNTAVGRDTLKQNTGGDNSTAVGYSALERFVSNTNTAVGYRALYGGDATPTNNTGTNNIAIGYQAGDAITTGSTNIVIGHDIDVDSATGNNQINIGGVYFHDRFVYTERTDPAAPAANSAVVYAKDNGSGKTQLCVRFNTGAVQVLATEP